MNFINRTISRSVGLLLLLALCVSVSFAQQTQGSLRGQVMDELGGIVVGATVILVDQNGAEKTVVTNDEGIYVFNGLAPGKYTVRAQASGFALFETTDVEVAAGRREPLNIKLSVTIEEQKVTVGDERSLSTDSENNADALVLKGKDLDVLPDDPEDLAAALTALAGPSAGPNGGQIYIDGFTGGRMPPKEAIREVRVSQNPFNAENDRPGFGRVDILTRPGFDRLRGSVNFNFNDESLNARNPFAPERLPFQTRLFGFTLSGPVIEKKASFFVDFQRREEDDNDIINAVVLDAGLNPVRFNAGVLAPRRFTTFSPRFDYAFNQNHTLVARYTFSRTNVENGGVGTFNLFSRAINTSNTQHTFQLTETAVINPQWINETRFQYIRSTNEAEGDNTLPGVIVQDAFNGGGAPLGLTFNKESRWELQNYTTGTVGRHVIRFGVRLRGIKLTDVTDSNFNGTFVFTSIEQYRQTLLGTPGFRPTQFTLSGGEPEASVSQTDFGAFVQDEWRVRPNFTITAGLRYEAQSNIGSNLNFAPRIFFAWAPGGTSTGTMGQFGAGQPKFVIRGGIGLFYDRFSEQGTLQAERFNGINQQRFNITDPGILGGVLFNADGTIDQTTVPTIDSLAGLGQPQTRTQVAGDLQAPYSMLAAINVERQLPYNFTIFGVVFTYRTRNAIVLRNINAPLPGTFNPLVPGSGVRPFGNAAGNIYQYESSGVMNDVRFQVGIRNQLSRTLSIFANYQTGVAKSNTECIFGFLGNCFPASSYDLNADYGRVSFFPRHRFFVGGSITVPRLNITLNPFIIMQTGQFFNITTGRDNNGDRLFTDRPAFVSATTQPGDVRVTPYGTFDINPAPGAPIIPRNYGEGPPIFTVNLGISRTIGFGEMPGANAAGPQGGGGGGARAGGTGGGAPGGGGARGGAAGGGGARPANAPPAEKRYNFTFGLNFRNIFNRSNLCPPVGNLSSPLFGQAIQIAGPFGGCGFINTAAGNRRIETSIRFNF